MMTIALLVTCLVDQVHPEIGLAAVRLLRRAGQAVEFPAAQTCCGQPFYNAGYRDEAVRLARRTIEIFEPYEAVVLPSGSCTAMIRVEYPHLLHGEPDWERRALAMAATTYELSEFLGRFDLLPARRPSTLSDLRSSSAQGEFRPSTSPSLRAGSAQDEIRPSADSPFTYHDSCHMCRLLGLRDEPRTALETAGIALVEMDEPDRCCGFGGLFSVKMPEVSEAMTRQKLRRAAATGANVLVTADPGCLMQMRRFAEEAGVQVEHLAVVLEEHTR